MMLGLGLSITKGQNTAWTPASLGASLYDYWDAEIASSISTSGATVTAWRSAKSSYSAAQGISASRPIYSATSFNGRPGLTFDGADDELTYAGVGNFPTGSNASEIWILIDQTLPGATAGIKTAVAYGGNSAAAYRRVVRISDGSSVNRARIQMGTGGGAPAVSNDNVALNGKNVVRSIFESNLRVDVNGTAGAVLAGAAPATGTTRTRIGATTDDTPANFFQGVISAVFITAPLTADQAAQMYLYLKARGGIA